MNYFSSILWLNLILSLILLPQILHIVIRGQNPGYLPIYILGFMATHVLEPVKFLIKIYFIHI